MFFVVSVSVALRWTDDSDWLQQSHGTLSVGESRYKRWMNGWMTRLFILADFAGLRSFCIISGFLWWCLASKHTSPKVSVVGFSSLPTSFCPSVTLYVHFLCLLSSSILSVSLYPHNSSHCDRVTCDLTQDPSSCFSLPLRISFYNISFPDNTLVPADIFSNGTLQFGNGRRSSSLRSLWRQEQTLWREAARSRWRSLAALALVPASGLLFYCGDKADALRDDTSVHGQDCGVFHAWALHLALENCSFFKAWNVKEQLDALDFHPPSSLCLLLLCVFVQTLIFKRCEIICRQMPNLICFCSCLVFMFMPFLFCFAWHSFLVSFVHFAHLPKYDIQ